MNGFPMVWYPASDGIGWSTITHCTSVNSSSAKTRQNPRSNVDSPRRSMSQRDLDTSSLNLNIVALYTTRNVLPRIVKYLKNSTIIVTHGLL